MSNGQFYDNRLMAAPSPVQDDAALGLVFHHLPRAYYDRGHTRTNAREARTVAEAVIAYARNHGDRREAQSLGVVTFSTAQRNAILKELELLRRAAPECEAFFNSDSIEPFFVKTVENVQGDERDVIFISVGYGRDAEGYLAMNFGPLNREGGERRLNVLISRARYRCEVFSSITAEDIDADRAGSAGVAALKAFLDFAREGAPGPDIGRMASLDSPFEDAVAAQLRARGHKVVARVGSMGYHVDLAVVDPDRPGRYVLAVECDGAQYHAARSARDRDRLRQQVSKTRAGSSIASGRWTGSSAPRRKSPRSRPPSSRRGWPGSSATTTWSRRRPSSNRSSSRWRRTPRYCPARTRRPEQPPSRPNRARPQPANPALGAG